MSHFKDGKPYRFVRRIGETIEVATFTKWNDESAGIVFETSEMSTEPGAWQLAVRELERRGFVLDSGEKPN